MKRSDIPFNIEILDLKPENLRGLRRVSALDTFEGSSENFHPDGLFSVEIFGKVGDDRRNRRFSYIDIKVPVFHPLVYDMLVKLKRLYADIMSGTAYAVWDEVLGDFVKSSAAEGRTGYEFFATYWKDIKFTKSKSTMREESIKVLKKYGPIAMTDKIIVMPAGLRDLEVDENGRKSQDEINSMYWKILALSNTIMDTTVRSHRETLDTPRYQIQLAFNAVYDYVMSLVEGKKKLLLGRWAARNIFNGTRNVITAIDTSVEILGAPGNVDYNSTVIGLYQYMKGMLPVTRKNLRDMVSDVFPDTQASNQPIRLINKETFKSEEVMLPSYYFDQWTTKEGLDQEITKFKEESVRNRPVEIEGRYMFLIYKGPDMTFKIMRDIGELPEERSVEHVRPMTYTELFYLAVYKNSSRYPVLVTRYPISGVGSIYPSRTHLRTTIEFENRTRLDDNWQPMSEEWNALEYPVIGSAFLNSLVPHSSRLPGLGADFDGDTCSANFAYSEDAVEEFERFIQSRRAYIGTDGKLISKTGISTIQLVLSNMTGFAQ